MKRASYPIELRSTKEDGTGEWAAIVPELPQYVSYGATAREAIDRLQLAMKIGLDGPKFTLDLQKMYRK